MVADMTIRYERSNLHKTPQNNRLERTAAPPLSRTPFCGGSVRPHLVAP